VGRACVVGDSATGDLRRVGAQCGMDASASWSSAGSPARALLIAGSLHEEGDPLRGSSHENSRGWAATRMEGDRERGGVARVGQQQSAGVGRIAGG